MPGVSLLPGTWSDRIPRDQELSPPKIYGSRGYRNTHTYTAPFLPGGEETPIQVFSLGKEAREPGDGKGKGRKRSPPSSACPCDRLPGLQIPAWDPHPCSPPPGLWGGGAPTKEGSPARQDPAHPARHSRSPQGHTRWTRSRPRPLSHAVDPQGLTHTHPGPRAHPLPRGAGHTRREGLAGATAHRVGRRSDACASVWAWASFGGGATPSAPNTRGGPGCPTAARRDARARERPRLPPRPRAAPLRRAAAAAREAQPRPRGAPCGRHYAGSGRAPGGVGVDGGFYSPGLPCGLRHSPGAAAWKGRRLPPRRGPEAGPEPRGGCLPGPSGSHPNPATGGGCFLL